MKNEVISIEKHLEKKNKFYNSAIRAESNLKSVVNYLMNQTDIEYTEFLLEYVLEQVKLIKKAHGIGGNK